MLADYLLTEQAYVQGLRPSFGRRYVALPAARDDVACVSGGRDHAAGSCGDRSIGVAMDRSV